MNQRITLEPAECWAGCMDPKCPYTHMDSWRCDDGTSHFTRKDAEDWLNDPQTENWFGHRQLLKERQSEN